MIDKRHPIDNQWIKYKKEKLAEAVIIDSKSRSSIAELTRLDIPDSIRVGVGTKIHDIATRRLFSVNNSSDPLFENTKIIPLKEEKDTQPEQAPARKLRLPLEKKIASNFNDPTMKEKEENPSPTDLESKEPESNYDTEALSIFDSDFTSWLTNQLHESYLIGKIQSWSFKQDSISANSIPPAWLFNSFAVRGSVEWTDTTYSDFEPELNLGLTSSGNYYGLGLNVNWLQKIPYIGFVHPTVDGLEFGAQAKVYTKSISGENFGGIDALTVSPTARVYGKYHFIEAAQTLDYKIGLNLDLLAAGQLGLGGFKKSITNLFGIKIFSEVILRRGEENWDLGGSLEIDQQRLSNSNGSTSKQSLSVGLIARRSI